MTTEKKNLELLYTVLKETKPNLSNARIRDRFMKPIVEQYETFQKDKKDIYLEYCDKNDEEEPEISDGNYHFKNEILDQVNKELDVLCNEKVVFEPQEKEKIKELIETTIYFPKLGEVEIIDSFIEQL